jgi:radical SAM protein with 4Fe4S-binding SPASM domain
MKKIENLKLKRIVMEVFGGCNYTCKMCPQSNPGRGKNFTRKMPLNNFKKILNDLVPKYGNPQINLEGSGEPTMAKDLPEYIKAVKEKGLKCFMYCNGARLNGQFMRDVVDAGIDFIRVSVIGYNKEKYNKWMNVDNFDLIISNLKEMQNYINQNNKKCSVSTYHLITDNSQIDYEISEYKNNVISQVNSLAYIWKMHNWSGNYDNTNPRKKTDRRSCGRPFAPEITIRAGGEAGRTGALVPCCQTLGPPNEEKSILGHVDKQSLEEIYNDLPYKKLIEAHTTKEFDKIDYCKDCDFLYEDPEVMVWSNDKEASINHMLGTDKDFILTEYSPKK